MVHGAAFDLLKKSGARAMRPCRCVCTASSPAALTGIPRGAGCCRVRRRHWEDALVRVGGSRRLCAEDFYSTTNNRTSVRITSCWVEVDRERMDAAIVIEQRDLRSTIRAGDGTVLRRPRIKVVPEFQARDRLGFAFMTNEDPRRVEVGVARIAAMRAAKQAGGRIAFVVPW